MIYKPANLLEPDQGDHQLDTLRQRIADEMDKQADELLWMRLSEEEMQLDLSRPDRFDQE